MCLKTINDFRHHHVGSQKCRGRGSHVPSIFWCRRNKASLWSKIWFFHKHLTIPVDRSHTFLCTPFSWSQIYQQQRTVVFQTAWYTGCIHSSKCPLHGCTSCGESVDSCSTVFLTYPLVSCHQANKSTIRSQWSWCCCRFYQSWYSPV